MRILYFGEDLQHSTSFHRAEALSRLGHDVAIQNVKKKLGYILSNPILSKVNYHTGYSLIQHFVLKELRKINIDKFDLILVNSGELFGSKVLKYLKSFNIPIILYNNDDPTGGRDGRRFSSLIKAIPFYDVCFVMRNMNIEEYYNLGAQKVVRVMMSYDELVHAPFESNESIPDKYISDVVFIGTWMNNEKRDNFLYSLICSGINVTIWGNRWEKSPLWNELKNYHRGGAIGGRDYVAAIQGAKICIGMLSKGNRDEHTQRSMEIPFAKGLLCAERTDEHLNLYKEGIEAVFWSDVDECIEKCNYLLDNPKKIQKIKEAGNLRVKHNKQGNEDIMSSILKETLKITSR